MQQLIASNINSQIMRLNNVDRLVDVVRSIVFTSTRSDTPLDSLRANMITDFHGANFEVHRLITSGADKLHLYSHSFVVPFIGTFFRCTLHWNILSLYPLLEHSFVVPFIGTFFLCTLHWNILSLYPSFERCH